MNPNDSFLNLLCAGNEVIVSNGDTFDRYRLEGNKLQYYVESKRFHFDSDWHDVLQPFQVINHIMHRRGCYRNSEVTPYIESDVAQK